MSWSLEIAEAEYHLRVWQENLKRVEARMACGYTREQCEDGIARWIAKLMEARSGRD